MNSPVKCCMNCKHYIHEELEFWQEEGDAGKCGHLFRSNNNAAMEFNYGKCAARDHYEQVENPTILK